MDCVREILLSRNTTRIAATVDYKAGRLLPAIRRAGSDRQESTGDRQCRAQFRIPAWYLKYVGCKCDKIEISVSDIKTEKCIRRVRLPFDQNRLQNKRYTFEIPRGAIRIELTTSCFSSGFPDLSPPTQQKGRYIRFPSIPIAFLKDGTIRPVRLATFSTTNLEPATVK